MVSLAAPYDFNSKLVQTWEAAGEDWIEMPETNLEDVIKVGGGDGISGNCFTHDLFRRMHQGLGDWFTRVRVLPIEIRC